MLARIVAVFCVLLLAGCDSTEEAAGTCTSDLSIEDTVVGQGAEATEGRRAFVLYEGWLCDLSAPENKGERFDASLNANAPFSFVIGAGRVIDGWDAGVKGMNVGGQRTLTIPASMAYGASGVDGVIPPNSDLIFEVELLSLQ